MQQAHADCHRKLYRTKLRPLLGFLVGSRKVEHCCSPQGETEAGAYCLGKGCKTIKWPDSNKLGQWSLINSSRKWIYTELVILFYAFVPFPHMNSRRETFWAANKRGNVEGTEQDVLSAVFVVRDWSFNNRTPPSTTMYFVGLWGSC